MAKLGRLVLIALILALFARHRIHRLREELRQWRRGK